MHLLSRRPARALLLATVGLSPLMLASSTNAADAPTRIVDLNEAGQRAGGGTQAIGAGGRELLLTQPVTPGTSQPTHLVVRDLVAGKTTKVLPSGFRFFAASDDVKRVLVGTKQSFDPADTNGVEDLYVYDRVTGRGLLATRDAAGVATGTNGVRAKFSGDGKVVYFSTYDASTFRVTPDSGVSTKIASVELVDNGATVDRSGRVVLAWDGIYVDGKRIPNPSGIDYRGLSASRVADNGGKLVAMTGWLATSAVQVVDLETGVRRTVALPSWVKAQFPTLLDVNAAGTTAAIAIQQSRGALGMRQVIGTLDLATGAVAQLGSDLPWPGGVAAILTPDWDFAATEHVIAQLGSTLIPGSDVVIPPVPPRPATDYLSLYQGCRAVTNRWPTVPAQRPRLAFNGLPVGISPQVPVKADVVVTVTSTGVVTNRFTLASAGAYRDLNAGFGNYTISAKVTFKDGTSVTGSRSVGAYSPPSCPVFGW